MNQVTVVILAAGEGKRMRSEKAKVLHEVAGKAILDRVMEAAAAVSDSKPIVVAGCRREQVIEHLGDRARIVLQEEQKGTGHAVMMAQPCLNSEYTIITAGDMPLLTGETLCALADRARTTGDAAVLLSSIAQDPTGYGRILRDENGGVLGIVEHADATPEQRKIQEVNASVYCFRTEDVINCLAKLRCDNAQGEYYLTDCIEILIQEGKHVGAVIASGEECMGVNDMVQLAQAEAVLRQQTCKRLMKDGVRIVDPAATYIDDSVRVGQGTVIYPGVTLSGETVVGENCVLRGTTRIHDSVLGSGVSVENSVILESQVGDRTAVGPFAYLRPNSRVGADCKVGDFVELKNTVVGDRSKLPHLCYAGDGDIGSDCNIACGVIFVNYDGKDKHRTRIHDHSFIGCNVNLVAPVEVGSETFVAAGTTVTEDVPDGALCIGRANQTVKKEWARLRRKKGKLK